MADIAESHGSSWVRDRLIDVDSFGFVFLAKNRDPDLPAEIAVKSFSMSLSYPLQFQKELLCNLGGSCSNVLRRCYGDEITTTKSGEKVYNILLEYCSGSSLRKHIAKFGPDGLPEDEVRRYTRDIVRGLYYLHCNAWYIHCNINSSSILLSPTGSGSASAFVAKIANLESAKKLTSQVSDCDFRGSYTYMSPELANDGYLDWPADIWALGCVVSEMLTGTSAFRDACKFRWEGVCEHPKIPNGISRAGKDFLRKCFVTSPYKRTPTWLLIKHPFVSF